MKNKIPIYVKRANSILLTILLLSIPIVAQIPETQQQQNPVLDAEAAAERDVDKTMWLALGCLLGVFGLAAAYLIAPNPPAQALLGKSPEYIAVYTDAYRKEGKKLQGSKALIGCLAGTAVQVVAYLLIFAAAEEIYYY